jgi:hypothetical protein
MQFARVRAEITRVGDVEQLGGMPRPSSSSITEMTCSSVMVSPKNSLLLSPSHAGRDLPNW